MKFIKYFVFLILPIALVTACSSIKGTQISAVVKGAENMTAYLDEAALTTQSNSLVTQTIGADGSFKMSLPDGIKAGVYRLRIGEQIMDIIVDGTEKDIKIDANLTDFNEFNYKITGSPLSEEYLKTVKSYIAQQMDVPALTEYTSKTADPLVAFQIAARLFTFRPEFSSLHKEVADRLIAKYPKVAIGGQYKDIIAQLDQQAKMEEASANIKVGQMAPDISLPDPKGKVRKLSDLKGKVVLIDFWASWCGPCRKANPHVVEVYHKYKQKGFDVFSVSLDGLDSRTAQRFSDPKDLKQQMDASKDRWLAAIDQDQLAWPSHVSDLKKWESEPAGIYGVRSIPQTFLVDKEGKIAVINPRNDLEEQILKFL